MGSRQCSGPGWVEEDHGLRYGGVHHCNLTHDPDPPALRSPTQRMSALQSSSLEEPSKISSFCR